MTRFYQLLGDFCPNTDVSADFSMCPRIPCRRHVGRVLCCYWPVLHVVGLQWAWSHWIFQADNSDNDNDVQRTCRFETQHNGLAVHMVQ